MILIQLGAVATATMINTTKSTVPIATPRRNRWMRRASSSLTRCVYSAIQVHQRTQPVAAARRRRRFDLQDLQHQRVHLDSADLVDRLSPGQSGPCGEEDAVHGLVGRFPAVVALLQALYGFPLHDDAVTRLRHHEDLRKPRAVTNPPLGRGLLTQQGAAMRPALIDRVADCARPV